MEEMLRSSQVRTGDNGLVYAVVTAAPAANGNGHGAQRELERMVSAVPRDLVPRLGRSACYFVPWLVKQRRSVVVGLAPAAEGESRKELCHHLDIKPGANLLLISLQYYEHDSYGLAMEFFDKIAYLAALEPDAREDFGQLLRQQLEAAKSGEITADAWEWRKGFAEASAAAQPEAWQNYLRAAETDAMGLYMASLYTDIFYEDLFEAAPGFPPLAPELVYARVRAAERLYPANRGFNLQIVRQRPRRRRSAAS